MQAGVTYGQQDWDSANRRIRSLNSALEVRRMSKVSGEKMSVVLNHNFQFSLLMPFLYCVIRFSISPHHPPVYSVADVLGFLNRI